MMIEPSGLKTRRGTLVVLASLAIARALPAQQLSDSTTLTLSAAVRLALAFHPSVAAARAGEAAAAAQIGEAAARRLPQLDLGASVVRFEEPMIVAPLHALNPTAIQFERTLVQGTLNLGYTLFDGGARGARVQGARAEGLVAAARLESAETALITEVSTAYLHVLSAQGTLDAELQSLEALRAERARVSQLLNEGRASRVELLRVDAAIAQADAERIATASELDTAERELGRLLGVGPERTRASHLRRVQLADTIVPEDRQALVDRLVAANPQLAQALHATEAAESARRVAIAAWFPHLEIVGGYHSFGSAAGDFSAEWHGGVRLSYPLFTGAARSRVVSEASARATVAREQYRLARLRGEAAIDRALAAIRQHRARVAAIATAVAHLSEVARIEQLALEAGAGTQTDYLRAQADLRRARASLVQARHAEIGARVELARIVGDLSPAWLDEALATVQ